jgi:serine/threonine-protein kinase HipA
MLTANIFFYGRPVGVLSRSEKNKYSFQYLKNYIESGGGAISFSLPLQEEPFVSNHLHAFFSGLVSEGWLRKTQSKYQRIDEKDEFSLLVNNGKDLSGAVTIEVQNMSY